MFSSDHGPAPVTPSNKDAELPPQRREERLAQRLNMLGSPGPLQGGKHGMYEGGVRVPLIVRWPGSVPVGRVDMASVIGGVDWLPTLCAIAGIDLPDAGFDGENITGAWLAEEFTRTRPLFWKTNSVRSSIAIRDGDWKLHYPNRKRGEVELYNLAADPGEATNLAAKEPGVVERLTAKIEAWNATLPTDYDKSADRDDE